MAKDMGQDGHFEYSDKPAFIPVASLLEFGIMKLATSRDPSEEGKIVVQITTAVDGAVQELNLPLEDGVKLLQKMIWELGSFGEPHARALAKVCWPDENWD